MSTAPMITESPLALLLDGNAALAQDSGPVAHDDPYARWHGFMERAVRNTGVVASVSNFLTRSVGPVWNVDGPRPVLRRAPARRR